MSAAGIVRVSKHHGLGNDFVVALVTELPADAAGLARRLCDRQTGIGADGMIFGLIDGLIDDGPVSMRLFNRDGSEAETSGNGLRCLTQAVARLRGLPELELDVQTLAGLRRCVLHGPADVDPGSRSGTASGTEDAGDSQEGSAEPTVIVSVEMGDLGPGPVPDVDDPVAAARPASAAVSRWATGSIGNPHVVCEVDGAEALDGIDVEAAGSGIEAGFGGGVNVHFATVSGPDEITARVWERGVGVTKACGSGAVVMAACFRDWGQVGDQVTVRMLGGDAGVDLSGPVTLRGPAGHVADFEISDEISDA